MNRAFKITAVLGLATLLAACDKCGEPLRPFGMPKSFHTTNSCTDSKPAG
jgi:hypothetical protein